MPESLELEPIDVAELGLRLGILKGGELDAPGLAHLARTAVRRWRGAPRQTVQLFLSRQLEATQHPEPGNVARDCVDSLVLLGDVGQLDVAGRPHLFPAPAHVVRVDTEAFLLGSSEVSVATRARGGTGAQRYIRWLDDPADVEHLLIQGAVDWDLDDWLAIARGPTALLDGGSLWQKLTADIDASMLDVGEPTHIRVVGAWSRYFGGLRGEGILAEEGRWQALDTSVTGVQIGARRGYTDHHWHPCVLRVDGGVTRVVDLGSWEAFTEALVARGAAENRRERLLELTDGRLQQTCPLPAEIARLLALLATPVEEESWSWTPLASTRPVLLQTLRKLGLDITPT